MNAAEKARLAREEKEEQKKQLRQDRADKTKNVLRNVLQYIWIGLKYIGIGIGYVFYYIWIMLKYIGIGIGFIFTRPIVLKILSFITPFVSFVFWIFVGMSSTIDGKIVNSLRWGIVAAILLIINGALIFAHLIHYELHDYDARTFCLWVLWITVAIMLLTILASIGASCA